MGSIFIFGAFLVSQQRKLNSQMNIGLKKLVVGSKLHSFFKTIFIGRATCFYKYMII